MEQYYLTWLNWVYYWLTYQLCPAIRFQNQATQMKKRLDWNSNDTNTRQIIAQLQGTKLLARSRFSPKYCVKPEPLREIFYNLIHNILLKSSNSSSNMEHILSGFQALSRAILLHNNNINKNTLKILAVIRLTAKGK